MLRKKLLVFIICFSLFNFLVPENATAAARPQIITRNTWGADSSLISSLNQEYLATKNILVEDIVTHDANAVNDPEVFVNGLYYYLATEYHEDIPVTYLVDWQGNIYTGAAGGIGAVAQGNTPDAISIGYIDTGGGLTAPAKSAIASLLLDVNTRTGISIIQASNLIFTDGVVTNGIPGVSWKNDIKNLVSEIHFPITAVPAPVLAVNKLLVTQSTNGTYRVYVPFVNNSDVLFYGNVYAGAATPTPLAAGFVWVSTQRSNAGNIAPVQPGGSGSFSFFINGAITKGEYGLNLYNDTGLIPDTAFLITIAPNAVPVITHVNTVTVKKGIVHVYTANTASSSVAAAISGNTEYQVTEIEGAGNNLWYKILYDRSHTAWIQSSFIQN